MSHVVMSHVKWGMSHMSGKHKHALQNPYCEDKCESSHVTCELGHVTREMGHVACETSHVTREWKT